MTRAKAQRQERMHTSIRKRTIQRTAEEAQLLARSESSYSAGEMLVGLIYNSRAKCNGTLAHACRTEGRGAKSTGSSFDGWRNIRFSFQAVLTEASGTQVNVTGLVFTVPASYFPSETSQPASFTRTENPSPPGRA